MSNELDTEQRPRLTQGKPWSEYPLGTKAYNFLGGYWLRVATGWQWNGCGGIFPTPGGDAIGRCIELPTRLRFSDQQVVDWVDRNGWDGSMSAARTAMEDAHSMVMEERVDVT